MSKEQKRGKETANVVRILRSLTLPRNMAAAREAIEELRGDQERFEVLSTQHGELLTEKSELCGQLAKANEKNEALGKDKREFEEELAYAINDLKKETTARVAAEERVKDLNKKLGLARKQVEALANHGDKQLTHIMTLGRQRARLVGAILAGDNVAELIEDLTSVGKDGVTSVPGAWLNSAAEILKEVERAEAAKTAEPADDLTADQKAAG